MNKWIPVLLASLLAVSASAGGKSFKDWLKELDARLRRHEKRYHQLTVAAAVRGDKTKEAPKLYWKGRKEYRPVTGEELKAFRAAITLAEEGKTGEARAGLEA